MTFPTATLFHKNHVIDPRDRISALPAELIHRIMERLPLRDAAGMSILSKTFRKNWLTLPSLAFDGSFFKIVLGSDRHNIFQYSTVVSKILLQHSGPIVKFSIHIPRHIEPDITQWISFLSMNCVKEFSVNNWNSLGPLKLPSHLFYCAALTKLKLGNCHVTNPPTFFEGFQCLISLDLCHVSFPSDHMFKTLVIKCPRLEILRLRDHRVISSHLHVHISAPKLKCLTISTVFKSICLEGCLGLQSVSITLLILLASPSKKEIQELIKLIASSNKVEKLSFGRYLVKFLAAGGALEMLPVVFTHVRSLWLTSVDSSKELSCVIGIIQSCPNVESLHVSVTITRDADTLKHNLSSHLSCKFLRLRDITVLVNKVSYSELEFFEFLLACSPVLETFNLGISEKLDENVKLNTRRKLRQYRRASSNLMFFIFTCKEDFYDETSYSYSRSDESESGPSSESDVGEDIYGEEEEDMLEE